MGCIRCGKECSGEIGYCAEHLAENKRREADEATAIKTSIRDGCDQLDGEVKVVRLEGRWYVRAYNEGGYNCTTVDLYDLLDWVREQGHKHGIVPDKKGYAAIDSAGEVRTCTTCKYSGCNGDSKPCSTCLQRNQGKWDKSILRDKWEGR